MLLVTLDNLTVNPIAEHITCLYNETWKNPVGAQLDVSCLLTRIHSGIRYQKGYQKIKLTINLT